MKSLQELKLKTVILNIEANGLDPDQIWCATCIDIDTKEEHIFRRPDHDAHDLKRYLIGVDRVVGHNILNYDWPVLSRLCGIHEVGLLSDAVADTLVISRLLDFDRSGGHSLGAWAPALGVEKTEQPPWDAFSEALVEHSLQNCRLTLALYNRFLPYINSKRWAPSIELEHFICVENREIHLNGFHFNVDKAKELRYTINIEVEKFDEELETAFPPKVSCLRCVEPRLTKHGTLNRNDFRWAKDGDLSDFNGGPFSLIGYIDFNPGSPAQIVERLNEAGWKPTEKTKGHIQALRDKKKSRLKRGTDEYNKQEERLEKFSRTGWKVSEENLNTLPPDAPEACKILAKRIKYASRVRVLDEWIENTCIEIKIENESIARLGQGLTELSTPKNTEPRIACGIGKDISKPTELNLNRCSTSLNKKNENGDIILNTLTASPSKTMIEWWKTNNVNVRCVNENENFTSITITPPARSGNYSASDVTRLLDGLKQSGIKFSRTQTRINGTINGLGAWTHRCSHDKPNTGNIPRDDAEFGKEMRELWNVDEGYLVGVDAESIQLRVLAHYINDNRFTKSLIDGKKEDGTDPHSLNKLALGFPCKSRNDSKTFIYAWLLGAGVGKVAEILGCSYDEAKQACDDFIGFYPGLREVKQRVIPFDAARGFFEGFDGRYIRIFGDDVSSKSHFALAGYLQAGEVIVMKTAMKIWIPRLRKERIPFKLVNFVHDEWQTQVPHNRELAEYVANTQADSIREAGETLKLRCPMAGSILSGHGGVAIGQNWYETH